LNLSLYTDVYKVPIPGIAQAINIKGTPQKIFEDDLRKIVSR